MIMTRIHTRRLRGALALLGLLAAAQGCAVDAEPDAAGHDTGTDTSCGPDAPQVDAAEVWWGSEDGASVLVITTVIDDPDGALHEVGFSAWGDGARDDTVDIDRAPMFTETLDLLVSERIDAVECDTHGGFPLLITIPAAELPAAAQLAEVALQVTDADHHSSEVVIRPVCGGMDRDCP